MQPFRWRNLGDNQTESLVDEDAFISMEAYPDDLTHQLVRAASEELGMSPQEILQVFGEDWVLYTAKIAEVSEILPSSISHSLFAT